MLNIGCLVLLLALTACPTKDKAVEPKDTELIGKWQWTTGFACVNSFPSPIIGVFMVVFDNDSVAYFKNDTTLLKTNYSIKFTNNAKYLSVDSNGKIDSISQFKYSYLFEGGNYTIKDGYLNIGSDGCFITLNKIQTK